MRSHVVGAGRRISVVGSSGSGKTWLSRRIASTLQLPLLELDSLRHLPGWAVAADEDFRAGIVAFQDRCVAGWVIDGNYRHVADDLLTGKADTVVWLDFSRRSVMARLLRRTAGRVLFRRELWNGNRESLRLLLSRDPDDNVILWSWINFAAYRERYAAAAAASTGPAWIRLRSPREARRWLRVLSGRSDRQAARG